MAASSPLAASPGTISGPRTATNTGGQVTMAVNTPSMATPAVIGSTAAPATPSIPNLFDPSHIPTLYRRIQLLSQLLIDASSDPNSLAIPQTSKATEGSTATLSESLSQSNRIGPDIAMGATTEDDVTSGYEAALALSLENGRQQDNVKRTELALNIVKESQGLRDAFQRAREAVDNLEGGDMDIEEQEKLIELLQKYNEQQSHVRRSFAQESQASDISMAEIQKKVYQSDSILLVNM